MDLVAELTVANRTAADVSRREQDYERKIRMLERSNEQLRDQSADVQHPPYMPMMPRRSIVAERRSSIASMQQGGDATSAFAAQQATQELEALRSVHQRVLADYAAANAELQTLRKMVKGHESGDENDENQEKPTQELLEQLAVAKSELDMERARSERRRAGFMAFSSKVRVDYMLMCILISIPGRASA